MPTNNHVAKFPQLATNIINVITQARVLKWDIIWIRSEYGEEKLAPAWSTRPRGLRYQNVPMNEEFLASSHSNSGKRVFCTPGTYGAEFLPACDEVREERDTVLVKHYYSSITNTGLAEHLRSKGITTVAIAGVSASNCVKAAAADAFFHEFHVYVLPGCVGATSPEHHRKALSEIMTYYGRAESKLSKIPGKDTKFIENNRDERVLYYVNGSIPSWRVMMMLSELNVEYTPQRLKVMSTPRETRSAAFSRLNPRCKTPTFTDGGNTLIESMAILQYLEQKYKKNMNRTTTVDENWTRTLIRFHESENAHDIFEDIELCFEDNILEEEQERVVKVVDNTLAEMAHWEVYLQESVFVTGDEFGIADCAFYPCVAYLEHRGWNFDSFPGLKRYAGEVRERKCAVDACPSGWEWKGRQNLWKKALEVRDKRCNRVYKSNGENLRPCN